MANTVSLTSYLYINPAELLSLKFDACHADRAHTSDTPVRDENLDGSFHVGGHRVYRACEEAAQGPEGDCPPMTLTTWLNPHVRVMLDLNASSGCKSEGPCLPVAESQISVPVGVAYGSSVNEVEQALLTACQRCEYAIPEAAPSYGLHEAENAGILQLEFYQQAGFDSH